MTKGKRKTIFAFAILISVTLCCGYYYNSTKEPLKYGRYVCMVAHPSVDIKHEFLLGINEDGSAQVWGAPFQNEIPFDDKWHMEDDVLVVDSYVGGQHAQLRFKISGEKLYFIEEGSDQPYLAVLEDGQELSLLN